MLQPRWTGATTFRWNIDFVPNWETCSLAWDSQNNALITLLVTMERKDCLWFCQRTDSQSDDAQTHGPRSTSLTFKPQKLLESPLGAVKSAELWPELLAILIYGGNSKLLGGQRGDNSYSLVEVKLKILWLGQKYILLLFSCLKFDCFSAQSHHFLSQVVCYWGTWANYRPKEGKFTPESVDGSLCTHLIYRWHHFTGFASHRALIEIHLKLCWARRCQIFNQISGHLDGPGERLRAGRVQKSHRLEEDLASLEGETQTISKQSFL